MGWWIYTDIHMNYFLARLMKGLRRSISCVKGRIWVEGSDIILNNRFSRGGGINEGYFEDLVWVWIMLNPKEVHHYQHPLMVPLA
jgi:hypothetical protein